jgi:AcrR family transcriptional regulator
MAPPEIQRKRQARGEARIQSLLLAAEAVFSRVGYSKATTNEIAAEGGVSPATLYQFFKNKEEIANALALQYVEGMGHHHETADYNTLAKLPMKNMVASLLIPLFKFRETHPAFMALLLDAPLSAETREAKMALSAKFVERMAQLLVLRDPNLPEKDATYHAEVSMLLFKGFMCEINQASGKRKAKLIDSLIDLMATQLSKASQE